ncbi:MAG TPA: acyl-CoA dehydratase activase [Deltaproteobacteria bacterium]|nr:acyl-CoA dehydratase activase [Deltaproteobacteria bacterium]
MFTAGLDIGSITTKVAIMRDGKVLGTDISFTGYNPEKAWRDILDKMLLMLDLKLSSLDRVASTGYGRAIVSIAHKKITEIICHAEGAKFFMPGVRSVIDIGGQDSKFIRIDDAGTVADFVMNDKCSAGTGRFLEVMARALEVPLNDFGELSNRAKKTARISSMCTVFAESEVISLIAKGEVRENIISGIHDSIASRIVSMMGRSGVVKPVVMTGGVAKNTGILRALEKRLNLKIEVPPTAQVNGAIGAAILAGKE